MAAGIQAVTYKHWVGNIPNWLTGIGLDVWNVCSTENSHTCDEGAVTDFVQLTRAASAKESLIDVESKASNGDKVKAYEALQKVGLLAAVQKSTANV